MRSKSKTLNDKAWESLFEKYKILKIIEKNGVYEITASEINEFREARLMTKFDHKSNLPILFEDNELSILPVTRGSYIISGFEAYHKLKQTTSKIEKFRIPEFIQSIDFQNITSEATAINVAYLSGILADFIGEEQLLPTVNGRMGSSKFDFKIWNKLSKSIQNISVSNSQIEIDGGYEGFDSLTLIEAKNSLPDNFLVRQLYYPFRLWQDKIRKDVKSVFLTYSNGIFSLYEYNFQEPNNYNSLVLVKHRNYTLEQEDIKPENIISLYKRVQHTQEPIGIPFPQANSFKRIINICELLNENVFLTREEITYNYDFDMRQANYYTDAGRYLGLIDKKRGEIEGVKYYLTEKGKDILKLSLKDRNLAYVELILEKKAFNEVFKQYLTKRELPLRDEIIKIMKGSGLYNINSHSTYRRRASTVSGWINWILDLTR